MSETTLTTASRALDVPLGAAPDGTGVRWELTDPTGRPHHGLIVGPTGCGGTTALARIAAGARERGIATALAEARHHTSRASWGSVRPTGTASGQGPVGELLEDLLDGGRAPGSDPLLLLADEGALTVHQDRWGYLLRNANLVNVSVVARVHDLGLDEFGGCDTVRTAVGDGQHLILGRPTGTAARLIELELGHTVDPAAPRRPGNGVYRRHGRSLPVAVTPV